MDELGPLLRALNRAQDAFVKRELPRTESLKYEVLSPKAAVLAAAAARSRPVFVTLSESPSPLSRARATSRRLRFSDWLQNEDEDEMDAALLLQVRKHYRSGDEFLPTLQGCAFTVPTYEALLRNIEETVLVVRGFSNDTARLFQILVDAIMKEVKGSGEKVKRGTVFLIRLFHAETRERKGRHQARGVLRQRPRRARDHRKLHERVPGRQERHDQGGSRQYDAPLGPGLRPMHARQVREGGRGAEGGAGGLARRRKEKEDAVLPGRRRRRRGRRGRVAETAPMSRARFATAAAPLFIIIVVFAIIVDLTAVAVARLFARFFYSFYLILL